MSFHLQTSLQWLVVLLLPCANHNHNTNPNPVALTQYHVTTTTVINVTPKKLLGVQKLDFILFYLNTIL